jgi:hypothetical protein
MATYPNNSMTAEGWLFTSRLYGRPHLSYPHVDKLGAQRGNLTGMLLKTASFPDGYDRVPMMPLVAGGMSGAAPVLLDAAGALLSGGPVEGAAVIGLTSGGDLSVVVSMSGDGTVTLTAAGGLSLTIGMSGDGTVTLTGAGGLSLIVPFSGDAAVTLSAAADLKGRLSLGTGVEDATLTAAQVAQAVWAALAASNDLPGSMGELLNAVSAGGLSPTQALMLEELWRIRGLDGSSPVTVTATQETAGDIVLAITGDGETTSTLTRAN